MLLIDETAKRRESLDPEKSIPIVLADGQAWWFPARQFALYPKVEQVNGEPRCVSVIRGSRYGATFDTLLDKVEERMRPDNDLESGEPDAEAALQLVGGMMTIGHCLLSINYNLADEDYPALLQFSFDSEKLMLMWRQIMSVARGENVPDSLPKPATEPDPEPAPREG
jgi:hypothetical protein